MGGGGGISFHFYNHTKINSLCGQNIQFVNIKPGSTHGKHHALKS